MSDSMNENKTAGANSEAAVNSEKAQKEAKNAELREKAVQSVMEKTGWSYEETVERMTVAQKWAGIDFSTYNQYDFHITPSIEHKSRYKTIVEEKNRKARRKKEKNERFISVVTNATGWDRDYAEEMIKRSKTRAHDYAEYGFWELSEEEQKTYFTKTVATLLRKKYNKDPNRLTTLHKIAFYKLFREFFGRKCLLTSEMTMRSFKEKFKDKGKVVYKSDVGTGGKGIEIIEFDNDTINDVYDKIRHLPDGIVEEFIVQHPEMQKLSVNAVNTIRIVTIFTQEDIPGVEKDKVHFLYAGLRMALGKSYVDNFSSGGIIAGVNLKTGIIETDGVRYYNEVYEKHPDTGTVIKGFQIPYFKEAKGIIEAMCVAGKGLPSYVGWDIAITENGPIVIEANPDPGSEVLQLPYVPEKKGMRYMVEKFLAEPDKAEKN